MNDPIRRTMVEILCILAGWVLIAAAATGALFRWDASPQFRPWTPPEPQRGIEASTHLDLSHFEAERWHAQVADADSTRLAESDAVADQEPMPPPPQPPPRLRSRLVGIGDEPELVAVMYHPEYDSLSYVSVGGRVEQYEIAHIGDSGVTFARRERSVRLTLDDAEDKP